MCGRVWKSQWWDSNLLHCNSWDPWSRDSREFWDRDFRNTDSDSDGWDSYRWDSSYGWYPWEQECSRIFRYYFEIIFKKWMKVKINRRMYFYQTFISGSQKEVLVHYKFTFTLYQTRWKQFSSNAALISHYKSRTAENLFKDTAGFGNVLLHRVQSKEL